MGTNSGIEYVDHSLNFWLGCTPVPDSFGCDHCYARRGLKRWGWNPTKVVRTSKATWHQPLIKNRRTGEYNWKPGSYVFVCSWSDFFHKDADKWRTEAWGLMRKRPDLIWVIVTKRIDRAATWMSLNWDWANRILIVTCENQKMANKRIPQLLKLRTLFPNLLLGVSVEPLLEPVDVFMNQKMEYLATIMECLAAIVAGRPLTHINNPTPLPNWIIIGCESGPKRRPCELKWVRDIVNQCKTANVPIFVKQLSINGKVEHDIKKFPEWARLREMPSG